MNTALTLTAERIFTAKQVIHDFMTYVRNPLYISEEIDMNKTEKLRYLSKVLLCKFALILVILPIIYYTKKFTGAKSAEIRDTWVMYFTLVVIAPIMEEAIFRGILHYSRWSITIATSFLLGLLINLTALNDLINLHIGFVYLACIVLIPVIYYATASFDEFFRDFWAKNFKYIFHFVAISFGLIHLSNYTGINNYLFALPLVTSQIISGYVLGFVRMKFGLTYSVILHSAWNFVVSLGMLVVLLEKIF